ncbi:WhiB family transcriptional regulator [Microbacterium sp. WCS2018Hpa-9]|uniref:WhiB family transcriptional regulator n=1 Tax=Microbacterium sp. WCS2018Hpa-9 TaxID=3073635 RepID=UPI0037C98677
MRVYTDDHVRPETWMTAARCATTDPELWFPRHGDLPTAERAKKICRECPVRAQCLEFALRTNQREGIYAGYSPKSLERLRRNRT